MMIKIDDVNVDELKLEKIADAFLIWCSVLCSVYLSLVLWKFCTKFWIVFDMPLTDGAEYNSLQLRLIILASLQIVQYL